MGAIQERGKLQCCHALSKAQANILQYADDEVEEKKITPLSDEYDASANLYELWLMQV